MQFCTVSEYQHLHILMTHLLSSDRCVLLVNRCDDVYLAVRAEGDTKREQDDLVKSDSYITLSQSGTEHQDRPLEDPDSSSVQEKVCSSELNVLKVQLRQAEETAQKVQREVRAAVITKLLVYVRDLCVQSLCGYNPNFFEMMMKLNLK